MISSTSYDRTHSVAKMRSQTAVPPKSSALFIEMVVVSKACPDRFCCTSWPGVD
jgi:hypothetical protein